jgi:hypothetical protein
MFRTIGLCAGIVIAFTACFLLVRDFVSDKELFPMLSALSVVLILSISQVLPRHRQINILPPPIEPPGR